MKSRWAKITLAVIVLFAAVFLILRAVLPPTPTDEEIRAAIIASNDSAVEPLDLVYDEMVVPHRFAGRAGAVIWVPDRIIQRNYSIAYDRGSKAFYVQSFTTSRMGEDGTYRMIEP